MEDGSNIEIIKPYQHLFTAMFLPREIQIWSFLNFRILTNCMQLQYNLITHTYKCLWIVCMHMYNQLQWLFLFWIFVRLPGEETFESENRGHVEDQKEYTRFLICEEIGSVDLWYEYIVGKEAKREGLFVHRNHQAALQQKLKGVSLLAGLPMCCLWDTKDWVVWHGVLMLLKPSSQCFG